MKSAFDPAACPARPVRPLPVPERRPARNRQRDAFAVRRMPALAGAVLLALAAGAGPALAQEAPLGFSFGPGEVVTYDSNVLRLAGNAPAPEGKHDVSFLTSLTGTLHENYGREDLNLSATVGRVMYVNLTRLDYTQQDLHGTLRASLPLSVEAVVAASHGTTLAHFADLQTTARNVITRNEVNGDLDVPVLLDWRAVVGAEGNETRNSNDSFKSQDFNTGEVRGGIRYQPRTGNHVDLLVRSTVGTYVNGSPASYVGPGYRNRAADLSADWTFSGASHLHGRAGYVKHTNDDHVFPEVDAKGNLVKLNGATVPVEINRNFSGPAFDVTYQWQLTALTSVKIFGLRESGGAGDNSYQSAITHTYRITPSYQPTVKTSLDAYLEWSRRNYFTNVLAGTGQSSNTAGGEPRRDHSHMLGVTAAWNPRRWLQASLDLHHEIRDTNLLDGTGAYVDTVASLQIQGTF